LHNATLPDNGPSHLIFGEGIDEKKCLYFGEGDDLEADLVNAFLTPGGVAEIAPRPEPAKGEL
jgi:hypothetical protein